MLVTSQARLLCLDRRMQNGQGDSRFSAAVEWLGHFNVLPEKVKKPVCRGGMGCFISAIENGTRCGAH